MKALEQLQHAVMTQDTLAEVTGGGGSCPVLVLDHLFDVSININNTTNVTLTGNDNTLVGLGSILSSFL